MAAEHSHLVGVHKEPPSPAASEPSSSSLTLLGELLQVWAQGDQQITNRYHPDCIVDCTADVEHPRNIFKKYHGIAGAKEFAENFNVNISYEDPVPELYQGPTPDIAMMKFTHIAKNNITGVKFEKPMPVIQEWKFLDGKVIHVKYNFGDVEDLRRVFTN
eukprot:CAMPEP_0114340746 /NCGR_PEP_ID=MMETSP0101-20121206/8579_1 /TAXON_ID=38822 ORGANISM="Pteridomonas danica, Strain PT" /NCGR_SAMPLE_ID=MMETSP0101 /ASSEMBLY_ACC=CAM_ASM_000211 /LENGTH=159 /DNA_ID=CAMNT_0001474105 /DNA_START=719 /DNA_END=1198 /DNA_ORIENTATION=+